MAPSGTTLAALPAVDPLIAAVVRDPAPRITASLPRVLGDLDSAEDATQPAILVARETWPTAAVPERPGAWLMTVAGNRAIDRLRREARGRDLARDLARLPVGPPDPDDRLRLLFRCCHPALARLAQVALTVRTVRGLTTAEVARALLATEPGTAQRIVRAKRTIVTARIPYRLPSPRDLQERLREVLAVLYLMFNEGYLATGPTPSYRLGLAADATWLTALLSRLMPAEPEVQVPLALCRLHTARLPARVDPAGPLVLIQDPDRSLWDHVAIAAAARRLDRAEQAGRVGPSQLQARIASVHARAPSVADTDWGMVRGLDHQRAALDPSPVVALNRAIALGHAGGPAAALAAVDHLAGALPRSHLLHAARAERLRTLAQGPEARVAFERARQLTSNPAELAHRAERIGAAAPCAPPPGRRIETPAARRRSSIVPVALRPLIRPAPPMTR
ncbi:MAG TPA: DUF6596 domain-containing protein [Verrucomicrobiae bacterium]|nr:DUF6596 domain-containing protein [Verrucomicrobiae bacterium]